MRRAALAGLALLATAAVPCFSTQAAAQGAVAGHIPPAIQSRTTEILAIMRGQGDIAATFHPTFLAEVPAEKLRTIVSQLRDDYGKPLTVQKINASSDNQATFDIVYERGVAHLTLAIAGPEGDSKVTGFWITQVDREDDSFTTISAELSALSGQTGIAVYELKTGQMLPLLQTREAQPLAIGSGFKLAVLAMLDEDIRAGHRKWSDVVPLTHKSLPSGQTQNWPDRAPMTLHSLATLMISISDNSATDTLLHLLGRARVSQFALNHDTLDSKAMPMLSTLEAFILKEPEKKALRDQWAAGSIQQRAEILNRYSPSWTTADTKGAMMAGTPQSIDSVEWFASPRQMANMMAWYARTASPEARAILGVNPGLSDAARRGWRYVGYKGGSEPGVIAVNYLLTDKKGHNYIISAAWNDPSKAVNQDRFFLIVNRAINMVGNN